MQSFVQETRWNFGKKGDDQEQKGREKTSAKTKEKISAADYIFEEKVLQWMPYESFKK